MDDQDGVVFSSMFRFFSILMISVCASSLIIGLYEDHLKYKERMVLIEKGLPVQCLECEKRNKEAVEFMDYEKRKRIRNEREKEWKDQ